MEEKLVTIVVLPYAKAHILKSRLEAKKIECVLEEIHLLEGSLSSTIRVKILESKINKAMPVVEDLFGIKPYPIKENNDKKDKHILVPVDFSESSEKAAKLAYNIAAHLKVKLVILHSYLNPVFHSIPISEILTYDTTLLDRMVETDELANSRLKDFISKISSQIGKENWNSLSPEYIIKSGYAEEDIVAYAHKNHSQLIVMGSGRGDSAGTVGSVVAEVMYSAKVPLLVVPEDAPEQTFSDSLKVIYATNFDEKDFTILDKLMGIVKPYKAKLICVHVGQPKADGWDIARLEGMKDLLIKKYSTKEFECKLIVGKNLIESLDKFISEENIGLMALTTHKRNMITRLFNPSFAKKMMYHTKTPLLIFHA
ncbi:MAG: universal stress protein [Prolixibacteraceae bacterium]|nr:universal stress protein [Prolixibacteraceae bacterium]